MKIKSIAVIFCMIMINMVFLLSACTSSAPKATDAEQAYPEPVDTDPQTEIGDPYPVDQSEQPQGEEPYPASGSTQSQTSDPYPEMEVNPEDAVEIEWGEAEKIIMNGVVARVTQTHDGLVILQLKEGIVFTTRQPQVDDVLKVIEECGELCSDILVATE